MLLWRLDRDALFPRRTERRYVRDPFGGFGMINKVKEREKT